MNRIKQVIVRFVSYWEKRKILPDRVYNRIKQNSLTGKINFIILVLAVPMLVLISGLFLFLYLQVSRQIDETLIQKMIAARNAYNYYERTTLIYGKMLADNPTIKKELIAETINAGPVLRVAQQLSKSVALDQVTVYDKKGIVIVKTHKPSEFGGDEHTKPYVENALKKGKNTANLMVESNELVLQNTVPVYIDREIVGAVQTGYVLNHKFASRLASLTQADIYFILNGRIFSNSFFDKPPVDYDTIYTEENRTYTLTRKVPIGLKHDKPSFERLSFRYLPVVTPVGSPEITRTGIAVAVNPPFSKLLMFILFWGTFVFTLLVLFFGIVLAFKIGHNIADYAGTISNAMTRFGEGALDVRVAKQSADELGAVASSFNQLAQELQKRIGEIREANENLEQKVARRTEALNTALADVTKLQEMQEGDYLLMSLLIQPLILRNSKLDGLTAEFLMEQKKTFSFRGREGDIGGDICFLTKLRFADTEGEWLFFFNGDAMGKSSQGASGALICGVTLHSILGRTVHSQEIRSEPQTYLYRMYKELNYMFTLFDASMLMSAAFGLVQAKTGVTYYINCEHPWGVLYRHGRADFFEKEIMTRKLGMPEESKKFALKRFELNKGDTLIFGSDGRDDVEISGVIDSDEQRFLRIVADSRGDIRKIPAGIEKYGHRTDDLSLLSIHFTGA